MRFDRLEHARDARVHGIDRRIAHQNQADAGRDHSATVSATSGAGAPTGAIERNRWGVCGLQLAYLIGIEDVVSGWRDEQCAIDPHRIQRRHGAVRLTCLATPACASGRMQRRLLVRPGM